jgi:hypothetical protein
VPLIWRKQCTLTRRYAEFESLLLERIYNIPDCTINGTLPSRNSLLTEVIYSSYIGKAIIGGEICGTGMKEWDGG